MVWECDLILAQGCPAGAGGQWVHNPWIAFPAHVPWVKSRACPGTNCLWCQFPGGAPSLSPSLRGQQPAVLPDTPSLFPHLCWQCMHAC